MPNGCRLLVLQDVLFIHSHNKKVINMWTKPAYTDLRIGFEVTMYFANR